MKWPCTVSEQVWTSEHVCGTIQVALDCVSSRRARTHVPKGLFLAPIIHRNAGSRRSRDEIDLFTA